MKQLLSFLGGLLILAMAFWPYIKPQEEEKYTRVDVYQTRGVVVSEPQKLGDLYMVKIEHEDIDDFKNLEGEVMGMESMTMSFLTKEARWLQKLKKGSSVDFDFEARWQATPQFFIKSVK